ncbi:hypothetical protein KDL01_26815 [Actinospica durhamensis]|uniref:pPIWI-RE three-gene island domain-containing protein n=1 Tax=Actinospica durhamensis TaxID=1508375 RepID=A0A941EXP8_9ACTN|nr:hypothetical protein [Actinospica durhamensis]MBR7836919.1 hypothetical protein [Actinospica durhamensis]
MRSVEAALEDVVEIWMLQAERRRESPQARRARLQTMCEVEFGLYVQSVLMPEAAVEDAWVLFSGFPYRAAWYGLPFETERLRLDVVRHSLWKLRSRSAWRDVLDEYRKFDAPLRAYDVPNVEHPARPKNVSIAIAERWSSYADLLRRAPKFAGQKQPVAKAGIYTFPLGRDMAEVTLPEIESLPIACHELDALPPGAGAPLSFTWNELVRTAAEMDSLHYQRWAQRLVDIRVLTRHKRTFRRMRRQRITIDGIQHLLGIVGAGKSTLRDVIAVHMANQGSRVTVVVGDVAEQLKLVELYNLYTCRQAAPIIGSSGREEHAYRLHNRLLGRGQANVLLHDDPGFAYLSTACAVSALPSRRIIGGGILESPIPYGEAPCTRLSPRREPGHDGKPRVSQYRKACPFWSRCPRHHGPRELIGAKIWVATPASLVSTPVPWPQNAEKIRYLELAARLSDLVIVDEADRVQMQLDEMFAPTVTLISDGGEPSFLDAVIQHKSRELPSSGRKQLSNHQAENWSAALTTVELAADRLYAMLVSQGDLRSWVRVGYFNAWNLQLQLAAERYPLAAKAEAGGVADLAALVQAEAQSRLHEILDDFRDNPFGDRGELRPATATDVAALIGIVSELLHTANQRTTRRRLREAIAALFDLKGLLAELGVADCLSVADALDEEFELPDGCCDDVARRRIAWLRTLPQRFEFTLLMSVIEPRLALINAMWPRVASMLDLGFNAMYRRPADYAPIVPEAPMGNLMGFRFVASSQDRHGVTSGELQFFWNSGVGRELLRALPSLPMVDGRPGTNVLLMSGSSWAGASDKYHINVPVGIMLEPPREDVQRIIDESEMVFQPVVLNGVAQTVSGSKLEERPEILRRIAVALGTPEDGDLSRLEWELFRLPEARRHIMLLVGSYDEARFVADALHTLNPRWRDSVVCLVRDSDPATPADEHHAAALRRGDVERLAWTRAEILVAPLLAVERGHNILDETRTCAAIGSVQFLAKPNPRPDDLMPAVYGINAWAVRNSRSAGFREWVKCGATVALGAREFRKAARKEWFRLLARHMTWRNLKDDRDSVTWDLLVLIWQVIGRLVRGGVGARVVFVDAAFAPNAAARSPIRDTRKTSLLYSMEHVLRPFFERGASVSRFERRIVRALYAPFWKALERCLRELEKGSQTP